MSAMKKMFSGRDGRIAKIDANMASARAEALQKDSIDSQKAAQDKQLEIQQNERAANELAMGAVKRQRRGSRLLLAASTGFAGVGDTTSKLG